MKEADMTQEQGESGYPHDAALPSAAMLHAATLWQLPLMAGTAWWNAVLEAWAPCLPTAHRTCSHDPHHQLVVPDPIEADPHANLVA
jgi:hypothetical protein